MENKVTFSIEKINKDVAEQYLAKNCKNRTVRRENVEYIKNEIKNNKFLFNGQGISFDKDGNLIDGQHRLIAIIEMDATVEMLVIRGLNKEAFKTIDTGRIREARDVLSIEDVPYSIVTASAVKRIMGKFEQSRLMLNNKLVRRSNGEILEFYQDNKYEIDECVAIVVHLYNANIKVTSIAVSAAMLFLLRRENVEKADSFIREIFTGVQEGDDISALTLRKRLINSKISKISMTDTDMRNLFLSAFRGYCLNKNLSKIVITKNQYFEEV